MAHGYTQKAIGELLGITFQKIQKYELDKVLQPGTPHSTFNGQTPSEVYNPYSTTCNSPAGFLNVVFSRFRIVSSTQQYNPFPTLVSSLLKSPLLRSVYFLTVIYKEK